MNQGGDARSRVAHAIVAPRWATRAVSSDGLWAPWRLRAVRHYASGIVGLIASNLRKEFSGEPVFDSVSFKLERRDRLALVGPNGAGRATLLR